MTTPGRPNQPRSVRCPTHGYYYNPDQAAGCVKCLEGGTGGPGTQGAESSAPSNRRFSPVTVLICLLVAAAIGWGGYRFFRAMAAKGDELYAEAKETAGRIDPELVRGPLQELENLVYAEEVDPYSQGTRIQRAAVKLYQTTQTRAPNLLASRHGMKIVEFGNLASASEDVGLGTIDMVRVQREWEAVRAEVFHDAPWFKSAAR
jgi:hypothetical protein